MFRRKFKIKTTTLNLQLPFLFTGLLLLLLLCCCSTVLAVFDGMVVRLLFSECCARIAKTFVGLCEREMPALCKVYYEPKCRWLDVSSSDKSEVVIGSSCVMMHTHSTHISTQYHTFFSHFCAIPVRRVEVAVRRE